MRLVQVDGDAALVQRRLVAGGVRVGRAGHVAHHGGQVELSTRSYSAVASAVGPQAGFLA
jgi:hypothetical protein